MIDFELDDAEGLYAPDTGIRGQILKKKFSPTKSKMDTKMDPEKIFMDHFEFLDMEEHTIKQMKQRLENELKALESEQVSIIVIVLNYCVM